MSVIYKIYLIWCLNGKNESLINEKNNLKIIQVGSWIRLSLVDRELLELTKIIKTNSTGIGINIFYEAKMKTEDIIDTWLEKGEKKERKKIVTSHQLPPTASIQEGFSLFTFYITFSKRFAMKNKGIP